ncbi:EF-hand domain-containing protein [Marivita sp. S6314]|uniref:EF-hand domain-containing protein n=1 Tax=Marivita sp. S6314 TaxID=2926406 RepID=UPI001FF30146|nr:EF-hand domain-containing protein [Marivita sp. S6314]MCK0150647.1 EF-hand domain-containing protein [Marivita sp. S6314]
MTSTKQVSALLSAALLTTGVGTAVSAQEAGGREDRRAEMFARLDTDKNGSVSAEEFAAGANRFARLDTDGDGLLTAEELAAGGQDRATRKAARMIERLDSNDDGMLSEAEIEARRDPSRMFDRLDANDDGVVSEEEFAEARMGRGGKRHRNK